MPPVAVALPSGVDAASLGAFFTCALLEDGQIYCWGTNEFGQLGVGSQSSENAPTIPVQLPVSGATVAKLATSITHSCLLVNPGDIYCWGSNYFGEIGNGDNTGSNIAIADEPGELPSLVPLGQPALDIQCQDEANCALLPSGELLCWGRSDLVYWNSRILFTRFDGNMFPVFSPVHNFASNVAVLRLAGISCGAFFDQPEVFVCLGSNQYWGQLGIGNDELNLNYLPVNLGYPSSLSYLTTGGDFACALVDADVKCWGEGFSGQLGIKNTTNIGLYPEELPPASAALPPQLWRVSNFVYAPLQKITLDGFGFGRDMSTISLSLPDCEITVLTGIHLECAPMFSSTALISVGTISVTRRGFGTSSPQGPIAILPSTPVIQSSLVISGERGQPISLHVVGISSIPGENVVEFLPVHGSSCPASNCSLAVSDIDFGAQLLRFEIPPLFAAEVSYHVVVSTPYGVTQELLSFTLCPEHCSECYYDLSSSLVQCTRCLENEGWHLNFPGTFCINTPCAAGQVLTNYGALRCGCNQTSTPPQFIDSSVTRCVTSCGTASTVEFLDTTPSAHVCRICDVSCGQCSGTGPADCLSCRPGVVYTRIQALGSCGSCLEGFEDHGGVCSCPPSNYYFAARGQCYLCPADSYNADHLNPNLPGSESCTSCPPNQSTLGRTGASSARACVCNPNFFPSFDDATCIECTFKGKIQCVGARSEELGNVSLSVVERAGLQVAPGYWLTSNNKYLRAATLESGAWFEVVECLVHSACPGGSVAETCAPGYTGPICGLCAPGYGRLGERCAECPSTSISVFLVILILSFVVVGCVGVVYFFTRAAPLNPEKSDSGMMQRIKIAILHLQILGYISLFASEWPTSLVSVFSVPTSAANISSGSDNIAIDCAANTSLVGRAVVIFLLPLILTTGVALGFALVAVSKRDWSSYRSRTTQGAVALLYVAHPGIFQSLLKLLVCVPVGSQTVAKSDMNLSCGDPSFVALRTFAAFYVAVYGFGGLLAVFFLIKSDPTRFPFLTKDYIPARFFWDLVATIRTMLFVLLALFASASLQIYFGTWILLLSWMFQMRSQINVLPYMDEVERGSLWVLILTITTGSLYSGALTGHSQAGAVVALLMMILNLGSVVAVIFFAHRLVHYLKSGSREADDGLALKIRA
eukprot:TRINITY_DN7355_c0_g2_i1.p1 TRINITY_DN7355_c0_g2~~TRINITY_DN7355_c0_g2_i1.p1  ORF type:complete len:1295 (-),score=253.34 TRINITY_DN7355_c0_g2_i1:52-3522(-)